MKSQRKFSSIIINPKYQLKVAFYFFAFSFITLGFLVWYFTLSIKNSLSFLQKTYSIDIEVIESIQNNLSSFTNVMSLTFIGFLITVFLIWLKISHRIFGPLVPLTRHIKELQNGNYSSRAMLREGDFLIELKDELNLLAENLENKK